MHRPRHNHYVSMKTCGGRRRVGTLLQESWTLGAQVPTLKFGPHTGDAPGQARKCSFCKVPSLSSPINSHSHPWYNNLYFGVGGRQGDRAKFPVPRTRRARQAASARTDGFQEDSGKWWILFPNHGRFQDRGQHIFAQVLADSRIRDKPQRYSQETSPQVLTGLSNCLRIQVYGRTVFSRKYWWYS